MPEIDISDMTAQEQAEKILEIAKESGVQSNFFFRTTFERYITQLNALKKLKKTIDKEGTLVTKEYVKGRGNLYVNPALSEYNRTSDSANKTVSTLMKIIKQFNVNEDDEEEDPLMKIIRGEDVV